ncbi:MAG: hypothetical protein MO853_02690 [Candidatus Protistobacter heckmanni]|nr:hypothetical protein [Candidatus Protistobacter heckmanni]
MEAAAVDPLEAVAAQAPLPLWRGVTAAARGTEAAADAGEAREVEIVLDDCPRGAKARRETVAPPPVDMLPMDYIVTDQ